MKPNNIILEGITGSTAYGLATENSDIDIKGIFLADTKDILSLYEIKETKNHTDPDWCYHEIGKFIKLAIKCNPTILELLFLDEYTELNDIGRLLIKNRNLFLSNIAFKSYGGYAMSQVHKLNSSNGVYGNGRTNRFEKHTRHCFRLLYQGRELLETGKITVKVTPDMREELFAIGKLPVNEVISRFEDEFKKFDKISSCLPDKPNSQLISDMLVNIRIEKLSQ